MLSRRDWLCRWANGFGGLALTALLADSARAAGDRVKSPLKVRPSHFPPKARSVIFLFMDGGVSHIDTFDPKPRLAADAGKTLPIKAVATAPNQRGKLMPSPWTFRRYGQSGADISDLFPHVARHADDLCIVRSMVSDFSEHTAANYFMHSGSPLQGRPSVGAWITYGLGSPSRNLPGYIVLDSGMIPPGGVDLFTNGFLPASYQGTLFRNHQQPVADLLPREPRPELQRGKLDLLAELDRHVLDRYGPVSAIEAAIANYEQIGRAHV